MSVCLSLCKLHCVVLCNDIIVTSFVKTAFLGKFKRKKKKRVKKSLTSNIKLIRGICVLPLVEENQNREYLSKLDIHKSMGLHGMQPQVLRNLADVIVRPFSIIFE